MDRVTGCGTQATEVIEPSRGPIAAVPDLIRTSLALCSQTGTSPIVGAVMLWTIAVVLLVLWALGMVSSYTLGGFIHILLVVAVVVVLVRVIQGRKVVS
jgi:hypothetical protein